MKKYIQIMAVLSVILAILAVAGNAVWASPFNIGKFSGDSSYYPKSIIVTGTGFFNVGGVCTIDIEYKVEGLKNNVDSEIPIKESKKVPWTFSPRQQFFPGCHLVHFKNDKEVHTADTEDGKWKLCFGARPELDTKIFFYEDKPESGQREWKEMPSYEEDTFVCTEAIYTGVYMPAGKIEPTPVGGAGNGLVVTVPTVPGSLQPPPPSTIIASSGTYSVGGICALIVKYNWDNLYDDVWVEPLTQDTLTIPFPSDEDVLYLPGCHVIHYNPIYLKVTDEMGTWKICFAERPGKKMTIYYYTDDDENAEIPPWTPLPTTQGNGQACAPAMYTGVYVPAGR